MVSDPARPLERQHPTAADLIPFRRKRPPTEPPNPLAYARDDQDQDPDPSLITSSSRALPRPLSPPRIRLSQRLMARWLEQCATVLTPKEEAQHPVHYWKFDAYDTRRRPGFHGAQVFVLKFGIPAIMKAIDELTYFAEGNANVHWRGYKADWVWCWNDSIVSPARRLYAEVRDMNALSARTIADERRHRLNNPTADTPERHTNAGT